MILLVEAERLIDHIGNEKIPMQVRTAVGNLGQWPNGRTGNLEKWPTFRNNAIKGLYWNRISGYVYWSSEGLNWQNQIKF